MVAEIVRSNPDVVYAIPSSPPLFKRETDKIPLVALTGDPVAAGLVQSLAVPAATSLAPASTPVRPFMASVSRCYAKFFPICRSFLVSRGEYSGKVSRVLPRGRPPKRRVLLSSLPSLTFPAAARAAVDRALRIAEPNRLIWRRLQ